MKVAFDEHISIQLAEAFQALDGVGGMLRVEIVSARNYAIPKAISDVGWLEQFAKHGGKVVISGDAKMRGKLHEQIALTNAGFIVFFWARKWNGANCYIKSAMMMRWWPLILQKINLSKPGQFFEIPFSFVTEEMREVTPPKNITHIAHERRKSKSEADHKKRGNEKARTAA